MWYLLRVDALIGAFVFGTAGLVIFAMFAWEEASNSQFSADGLISTVTGGNDVPGFSGDGGLPLQTMMKLLA